MEERLNEALSRANLPLIAQDQAPVLLETLLETCARWSESLGDRIVDTLPIIRETIEAKKDLLLEGQLGVMRDLDWGIYPFVTSSNPAVGAACSGAGIPPTAIDEVLGVVKAYSTAVGAGPLVTESLDADGERLREVGQEYGATTGRPRRCGWFDGVAIRYATWLNGFTSLAVTKLDVLDAFEEIKVCGYRIDGVVTQGFLIHPTCVDEPIYETWAGWQCSTRHAYLKDLPSTARCFASHRRAKRRAHSLCLGRT